MYKMKWHVKMTTRKRNINLKYKYAKSAKHCQLCIITEKLHLRPDPDIFCSLDLQQEIIKYELNESSLFTLTLFMFNDVLTNIKRLTIVARQE